MINIKDLPILILGYNRFDKFSRCINTLEEQGLKNIYVSIDGPKNEFDKKVQKKIINFCLNNSLNLDIKIQNLNKNYGCRLGPINGITWFFKENKYGVILEDDVIISRKCIDLFSILLEEYYFNENIISISSFNEFTNKKIESIYEVPVWRSWGWASWAEKWQMHLKFSNRIKNLNIWQIYNLLPKEYRLIETAELIKSCQLNLMDAWDYEFNFSHIVNNKKSLTIGGINNYVYGFDNSATHTDNIKNVDIDFKLFCERNVDEFKIQKLEKNKEISTISKCGFSTSKYKNIFSLKIDLLKSLFFSFIFYLRIVKRNAFKKFYCVE
ncbi:hypothetical protein [Prochlorococcus marinus]|uniref:hypothetical protein n=1 Tax=Prochlorococcus marinus TaxID=1219 RepID=UPI001ADA6C3E|nr:hypothetical protein [Prochlorococcus marinus]MBO8221392.1 hypothetical protein [Prochlorococcus marinus CUG1417]MBW3074202.1 hypothetical protein [Prochlorococcus marinus str. MU1417]